MNLVRKLAFATVVCVVSAMLACVVAPDLLLADDTLEPTMHTVDTSMWPLSEEEAIVIASGYIPPVILQEANIHAGREMWGNYATGESHSGWVVTFFNISATQNELGWQPDDNTRVGAEPYDTISVTIDAVSGELISRYAYQAVNLGIFAANPGINSGWKVGGLIGAVVLAAGVALVILIRLQKKYHIKTDL